MVNYVSREIPKPINIEAHRSSLPWASKKKTTNCFLLDHQLTDNCPFPFHSDTQRVDTGDIRGGEGLYRRCTQRLYHTQRVHDFNMHLPDFDNASPVARTRMRVGSVLQ